MRFPIGRIDTQYRSAINFVFHAVLGNIAV
jgi:hypothetical protein